METFKLRDIFTIMDFADGFDDTMIYDKAIMAKQEVDTGLLATVFMDLYPLKMRIIEDVLHDSSVRHLTWDTGGLSQFGIIIMRTSSSLPLGAGGMMGRCPQFLNLVRYVG